MLVTTRVATLIAVVFVVGATAACNDRRSRDAEPVTAADSAPEAEPVDPRVAQNLPQGVTLEMAREGQRLYAACSVCHGLDARGSQLGPSLRDREWIHTTSAPTPEQIAQITRTGIPIPKEYPVPMPEMGGGSFTEAQLRSVAAYVYALAQSLP